jgi:nicotinic acid mononucleotide adenylyltransferase
MIKQQWKVDRDPYYKDLQKTINVEDAGFFEDTSIENFNIAESVDVLCTPLSHLKGLATAENPIVLLSTGSFCPLHSGHIDMMNEAKDTMEFYGFDVIGGFISPGNDEYINQKTGSRKISIHERISYANEKIKHIDWLAIDPWEGVFNKVAINFTDVVHRLELYLEHHLKIKVKVVFVCGGDNTRFALSFLNKGLCVVVSRPNYDKCEIVKKYNDIVSDHINIFHATGFNSESSTKVRENWDYKEKNKKTLYLRTEVYNENEKGFIDNYFLPYFKEIKIQKLEDQKEYFEVLNKQLNIISLDSLLISEELNLEISRCYDLFGMNFIDYVKRPKSISVNSAFDDNEILGEYWLFDDDIHTGGTMRWATKHLEAKGAIIKGSISLNIPKDEDAEILDYRDFFIGGPNNGLVVKLPNGELSRVPYMYPYVCPYIRASISDPMKFSIDMWNLNTLCFLHSHETLKDYPHYIDLFTAAGFSEDTFMFEICKLHFDYLQQFLH